MTRIGTYISDTGQIDVRDLPPDEAAITLTTMISHAGETRAALPTVYKEAFDEKMTEADTLRARLRAFAQPARPAQANTPPEPPEALLVLGSRDQLRDQLIVNNLLDGLVRKVDKVTDGFAEGADIDPQTAPAQLLRERLFASGRVYLTYDHPRQWYAIDTRFKDLEPEQQAAFGALGLGATFERIISLNDHFGRLLRVTRDDFSNDGDDDAQPAPRLPPTPADTPAATMHDFETFMSGLLGLANAAAPGDLPERAALRLKILAPYLTPVLKDVLERSARANRATTPTGDEDGGTPGDA